MSDDMDAEALALGRRALAVAAVGARLRKAAEAFRAAWPSVYADLIAVCDVFPDVPEELLRPLPQMVREVVEDAMAEVSRG